MSRAVDTITITNIRTLQAKTVTLRLLFTPRIGNGFWISHLRATTAYTTMNTHKRRSRCLFSLQYFISISCLCTPGQRRKKYIAHCGLDSVSKYLNSTMLSHDVFWIHYLHYRTYLVRSELPHVQYNRNSEYNEISTQLEAMEGTIEHVHERSKRRNNEKVYRQFYSTLVDVYLLVAILYIYILQVKYIYIHIIDKKIYSYHTILGVRV